MSPMMKKIHLEAYVREQREAEAEDRSDAAFFGGMTVAALLIAYVVAVL